MLFVFDANKEQIELFNDGLLYLRTCIPTTYSPTSYVPRNFPFVSFRYPVTLELERTKRISRALFNDDCMNGVRRNGGRGTPVNVHRSVSVDEWQINM